MTDSTLRGKERQASLSPTPHTLDALDRAHRRHHNQSHPAALRARQPFLRLLTQAASPTFNLTTPCCGSLAIPTFSNNPRSVTYCCACRNMVAMVFPLPPVTLREHRGSNVVLQRLLDVARPYFPFFRRLTPISSTPRFFQAELVAISRFTPRQINEVLQVWQTFVRHYVDNDGMPPCSALASHLAPAAMDRQDGLSFLIDGADDH